MSQVLGYYVIAMGLQLPEPLETPRYAIAQFELTRSRSRALIEHYKKKIIIIIVLKMKEKRHGRKVWKKKKWRARGRTWNEIKGREKNRMNVVASVCGRWKKKRIEGESLVQSNKKKKKVIALLVARKLLYLYIHFLMHIYVCILPTTTLEHNRDRDGNLCVIAVIHVARIRFASSHRDVETLGIMRICITPDTCVIFCIYMYFDELAQK